MYSHHLVLEECTQKWKEFFSSLQDNPEHKLSYLFLSDKTKEILEHLKFLAADVGSYSQITWNDAKFFKSPAKSGNMLCRSGTIDILIDITVENDKILFFDFYSEEQNEDGDWWNPKPILMSHEFPIIRHFMEKFKLYDYLEKAHNVYMASVNSKIAKWNNS